MLFSPSRKRQRSLSSSNSQKKIQNTAETTSLGIYQLDAYKQAVRNMKQSSRHSEGLIIGILTTLSNYLVNKRFKL